MTSGGRANRRGRILENAIHMLLEEEYQEVSSQRFFALVELEQPIFAKQFSIGRDIYNKKRRVDFILYHPERWSECLVIQCKWQASSGSVEEKYPFEVLSIQKGEYDTIIVLDGNGYTKGAEAWLKNQAAHGRLLHVFNLSEMNVFQTQGRL